MTDIAMVVIAATAMAVITMEGIVVIAAAIAATITTMMFFGE